jgi:hypothetical protein
MPTFLRPALVFSLIIVLVIVSASLAQPPGKAANETISIRTSEGTDLAFDVSPDGRSIVFDPARPALAASGERWKGTGDHRRRA